MTATDGHEETEVVLAAIHHFNVVERELRGIGVLPEQDAGRDNSPELACSDQEEKDGRGDSEDSPEEEESSSEEI